MDTVRAWVQALGLAALGFGVLVMAIRPSLPAFAAEPPVCQVVDRGESMLGKAADDVAKQTSALLAGRGDREHVAVMPVGRTQTGTGGTYDVVCVW